MVNLCSLGVPLAKASRATMAVMYGMKVSGETSSVIAGLAVGIAFVLLFATFFGQSMMPISFFASLKSDLNQYKVLYEVQTAPSPLSLVVTTTPDGELVNLC